MEGPLVGGKVSPDSQGLLTEERFAVCGFGNTQDVEEPAHQIQSTDPRPSTPAGETQGRGLQGGSLSEKPKSLPEQRAADGSGDCQRSVIGGLPVQSEEPSFSGVENLLYPVSSHVSLTQGENDNQGGGSIGDPGPGDPGPGKELPAVVSPLSEMPSKLLEAGKGNLGREWGPLEMGIEIWEVVDSTQTEALVRGGVPGRLARFRPKPFLFSRPWWIQLPSAC